MNRFITNSITRKFLSISLCIIILLNVSMIFPLRSSTATIGNNILKGLTGPYAKFVDNTYKTEMSGWHNATNLNASSGDRYVQPISNSTKLWIDLGGIFSISKLSLNWDSTNYATKYNIIMSVDDEVWTTMKTIERDSSGTEITNFPTIPDCRYIVIDVISVVGSSWALVNNSTGDLNAVYGVSSTAATNISVNKPVNLVDFTGADISDNDIITLGAAITDGDATNYAQTKNTKFGAIINLQGLAKISNISVTSHTENSISMFDIKGSKDGYEWEIIQTNISLLPGQRKLINIGQKYIGRLIWIAPSKYAGTSMFATGEITINGQMLSNDTNIANGKKVFGYENKSTIPITSFTSSIAKAVDGSLLSYNPEPNFAQATSLAPDWDFVIDYENVASVSVLGYTPEKDNYMKEFDVYTSFDGVNWKTFKTGLVYINDAAGLDGSGKTTYYSFAYPAVGRFIKISPTKVSLLGNISHCVTEIETIGYNPTGILPSSYKMLSLENGGTLVSTSAQYPAYKAFDGDNVTYTQSSTFIPWDLLVTLPDNYEITGIYLRSNATGKIHVPIDFTIETSNNGFGFLPAKTVTGNTDTIFACDFENSVVAKYLRLNVSKSSLTTSSSGFNIAEFQVYGKPKSPIMKPATEIVISSPLVVNLLAGDKTPVVIQSISPLDASSDIVFSSENTLVATVTNNGLITAVGGGITYVHVVSGDAERIIQVNILGNIALNKSASMSAEPGWSNYASYAIDGNLGSMSQANADTLWTLTVDLQEYFSVSAISVDQSDACYATKYKFEASSNGFSWFEVINELDFKANEHKVYQFPSKNARFIRFTPIAKQTNGSSIAIKEIGVFGEKINVENQTVNQITLDNEEIYINPRKEFQLTGVIDPVETMVSWTSSDENIAKVDGSGKVTALKSGVAIIYAKAGDKSDSCSVIVNRDLARNTSAEMIGASPGWGNIANFAIDGNKDTVAQSNNDSPWDLMVDIGIVQSINSIYYRPDGYNYAKTFSIKASKDKINWVTVTNNVETGDGSPKTFDVDPTDARYIWLDVESTIVKLPPGVTDSSLLDYGAAIMDFEVYGSHVALDSASPAQTSIKIPIGFSYPTIINYLPTNATIKSSAWKSADTNIATVDADGNIKGLNPGHTTVTATTYEKNIVMVMDITVYESENIALYNKNVWMDADVGFGNVAANAVDGSYQSVAQSMLNVPWTLFVESPIKVDIASFRITMNDFNFANHYRIFTSDNSNGPWRLVYENNNASSRLLTIFLDETVSANFVKFEAVSTLGAFGYAINEFEIMTAYGFDTNKIPKPNFLESGPGVWKGDIIEPNNNVVHDIIQTFMHRYISAKGAVKTVNTKELSLRLKNLLFENGELSAPDDELIDDTVSSEETSSQSVDTSSIDSTSEISTVTSSTSGSAVVSSTNSENPNQSGDNPSQFPILPILIVLLIANAVFLIYSFVLPKISVKK